MYKEDRYEDIFYAGPILERQSVWESGASIKVPFLKEIFFSQFE